MDRRRETRVHVNLNAAVVNDKALPLGCRVENVSSTGMLLRHEGSEDQTKIKTKDKVEVRISLKQNDARKTIQLPLTVIRQSGNYLGGQFPEPQPELMTLVEPYRISDSEPVIPFLTISANQKSEFPAEIKPAILDQAQPVAIAVESQSGIDDANTRNETATIKPNKPGRLLGIGVTCFVFLLVGLNMFLLQKVRTLTSRVAVLESERANRAAELQPLVQVDRKTFDSHLAIFSHQTTAIKSRIISLESSNNQTERQVRLQVEDPPGISTVKLATTSAAIRPVKTRPNKLLAEEISPSEFSFVSMPFTDTAQNKTENWVINLLSLRNERAALAFAQRARAAGIAVSVRTEVENQSQVWRVQIGGFSSRIKAGSYSLQAQETLGLTSVWIFKASDQSTLFEDR